QRGLASRLGGAQPAAQVLLHLHLEVETQLLGELKVITVAAQECAETLDQVGQDAHVRTPPSGSHDSWSAGESEARLTRNTSLLVCSMGCTTIQTHSHAGGRAEGSIVPWTASPGAVGHPFSSVTLKESARLSSDCQEKHRKCGRARTGCAAPYGSGDGGQRHTMSVPWEIDDEGVVACWAATTGAGSRRVTFTRDG